MWHLRPPSKRSRSVRALARATHAWRNPGPGRPGITPDLQAFIEAQTSVFLATANSEGQPYIQHRGGPPGFLKVLDDQTLGFVDFVGNRQYISLGNLQDNPKAHLFLIDYDIAGGLRSGVRRTSLTRIPRYSAAHAQGYKARASQVILLKIDAWDANCAQHIPQRFEAVDVAAMIEERDQRIATLEAQILSLRAGTMK